MGDADRVGLAFKEETVFGTVPAGNPAIDDLRFTGETLAQETTSVESAEIRDDRQISDVIRTSIQAGGDVNFEMSYDAYDEFLAAALQSAAWSSAVTVGPAATISATAPDQIDDSGSGMGSITAGSWIRISGFTTTGLVNNTFFKVLTAAAGALTTYQQTVATKAASDSVTIVQGAQITNDTTITTYSIEKTYTDLSNEFAVYSGMAIETFTLEMALESIITGTFGFMGKTEVSAAATYGSGTNNAAPTNDVMNVVDDILDIQLDYADHSATQFTIELTNNLRNRLELGELGAVSQGAGKCKVTGTLQAYFEDSTNIDKYLGDTPVSLTVILQDGGGTDYGNTYIIDLPQCKFTSGPRSATGENTDVIEDLAYTAYMDATTLKTIRIVKFAAVDLP